jgi:hypothetical protein
MTRRRVGERAARGVERCAQVLDRERCGCELLGAVALLQAEETNARERGERREVPERHRPVAVLGEHRVALPRDADVERAVAPDPPQGVAGERRVGG